MLRRPDGCEGMTEQRLFRASWLKNPAAELSAVRYGIDYGYDLGAAEDERYSDRRRGLSRIRPATKTE